MAKVDAEDLFDDENENALIDMWQAKPVLYDVMGYGIIIIGFLKLKFVKINLSLEWRRRRMLFDPKYKHININTIDNHVLLN